MWIQRTKKEQLDPKDLYRGCAERRKRERRTTLKKIKKKERRRKNWLRLAAQILYTEGCN